ncbi:hypothetical protein I315_03819 [Cryptococcus gattii Ru294]|nr:hypothetical protein I315_03819 [Cryptococcus gattii Ru294]
MAHCREWRMLRKALCSGGILPLVKFYTSQEVRHGLHRTPGGVDEFVLFSELYAGNQELDPATIYMARDIPLFNEKVRVAPDCLDIRIWEQSFSPPKIIPLRKEVLDSMQPVASIHIPSSRSPRAVESFMVVTIPIYRHTASS